MPETRSKKVIAVELMDEVTRTVVARRMSKNWTAARRTGISMLKAETDEKMYIRLHDINDASDVDFVTRERLNRSTGIAVDKEGKELKPRGRRKVDRTGKATKEYQQFDANYVRKGRVI